MKWYDSYWLRAYQKALEYFRESAPQKLDLFVSETDVFRIPLSFREVQIDDLVSRSCIDQMRGLIASMREEELDTREFLEFGRLILHNNDFFNQLQLDICSRIGGIVGERLQPSYNFLSLYNNLGICKLHMDAPLAKWTVDFCIEQSAPWPLFMSGVQKWPVDIASVNSMSEESILSTCDFNAYEMLAGEALVFGGSAQWHYRQRMPQLQRTNFCHLIFFHYILEGSDVLSDPLNWAAIFEEEELSDVIQVSEVTPPLPYVQAPCDGS